MSGNRDAYRADVDAVVKLLRGRGEHKRADRIRSGADDHLAGRTGCHNWASLSRILSGEDR